MKTNGSKNIVQNLLNSEVKDKHNDVSWHNNISNNTFKHKSNGFRSPSFPEVLTILKHLETKLIALVHCRRDQTPIIVEDLKGTEYYWFAQ